ncbi:hoxN [Symbiodinium microadriaticum]|nr:hoxN [Symbiodinium microadriaticum]
MPDTLTEELLRHRAEASDTEDLKKQAVPVLTGIALLTAVLAGCLLLLAPELLTMGVLAYCLGSRSKKLESNGGMVSAVFSGGYLMQSVVMFPVGFAFGLGFETSSEVAVLAMVGLSHSLEHPAWVMLLPFMFLVGMCLIDTANGILMAWVYGSGKDGNKQRLYYNMVVTATSAAIALLVGVLELLGVIATREDLHGPFWDFIVELNNDFETVGIVIVVFFLSIAMAAYVGFKYIFPNEEACGAVV